MSEFDRLKEQKDQYLARDREQIERPLRDEIERLQAALNHIANFPKPKQAATGDAMKGYMEALSDVGAVAEQALRGEYPLPTGDSDYVSTDQIVAWLQREHPDEYEEAIQWAKGLKNRLPTKPPTHCAVHTYNRLPCEHCDGAEYQALQTKGNEHLPGCAHAENMARPRSQRLIGPKCECGAERKRREEFREWLDSDEGKAAIETAAKGLRKDRLECGDLPPGWKSESEKESGNE